jgi:hypothetical protein
MSAVPRNLDPGRQPEDFRQGRVSRAADFLRRNDMDGTWRLPRVFSPTGHRNYLNVAQFLDAHFEKVGLVGCDGSRTKYRTGQEAGGNALRAPDQCRIPPARTLPLADQHDCTFSQFLSPRILCNVCAIKAREASPGFDQGHPICAENAGWGHGSCRLVFLIRGEVYPSPCGS